MKLYEEIKFSGYDWYIIGEKEDGYVLLMKDCLMNKSYLDKDNEIKFDEKTRIWRDSNIRKVLNEEFVKELQEDMLLEMNARIRYNEEDIFTVDKVRLLTIYELLELPYRIQQSNLSYWTMSPNGSYAGLFGFGRGGGSYSDRSFRAIRPVVFINKDKLSEIEEEKKIPEKIPLNYADDRKPEEVYEYLRCSYNQLIDYLKSKGE